VTYRCQGCREYHHTVYRRLGLGSVCSPECEATVRTRQRGGKSATKPSDRRDSYFIEPAPGAGDSTNEGPIAAPGDAGDIKIRDDEHQRDGAHDSTILDERNQRDGTHDCLPFGPITTKKTLRGGTPATRAAAVPSAGGAPATRGASGSRTSPRQDVPRRTARSRDWISIFERDQRCRYCGTRRNLHAHHIAYRSQGGNDDPHNLITLCVEHHDLVHTDKGLWQPLLRAYIWLLYIEGRRLFLLEIKRIYG
jgi:5-methylcytosine-specific restriction endonuclease McrA